MRMSIFHWIIMTIDVSPVRETHSYLAVTSSRISEVIFLSCLVIRDTREREREDVCVFGCHSLSFFRLSLLQLLKLPRYSLYVCFVCLLLNLLLNLSLLQLHFLSPSLIIKDNWFIVHKQQTD